MSGLCDMTDVELREAIAALAQEHGDVPPDEIKPELIDPSDWRFLCADDDPKRMVAVGRMEPSKTDWFSCTLKTLVVHPEHRGRGLGTEVARQLLEKAEKHDSCFICQADITVDNIPSRHIFEETLAFRVINDFCMEWEGKTAVVVHKDLSPREACPAYPPRPSESRLSGEK